ncbi:MAG TPA: sensor histidine kinase, partial [Clostridium sp.]|nr:sensor histidine kinase [Clostridium sp.]
MKIRSKFLIIFMLLILCLTLGGVLLNSLFLQPYYISKNKEFLIHEANEIKEQYLSDNENIENYIFTEAHSHGTSIFILDSNSSVIYSSMDVKSSKSKKYIPNITQNNYEDKHGASKRDVKYIEKDKTNDDDTKLMYTVNLDDGNSLILIKYVRSIQDSVKIANQFYIISGLVLFIAGSIFVLFFSIIITKPIIEMSNVAEDISNLTFNDVIKVN